MEQKKDFLEELAKNAMLSALIIAGICTLLGVVFKFVNPDTATLFTQLSFYAYGWMVFLSLGPACKHSGFMRVDVITSHYPEAAQETLKKLTDIIMLVLVVIHLIASIRIFGAALASAEMNAKAPVIPVALSYLASVLGYCLGLAAYVFRFVGGKDRK